jgi:exodeoxyribonuclease III
MKIVTWNCQHAFEKKAEFIFFGAPDIAVIQECSKKSAEAPFKGYLGQWVGDSPNQGLGVFYRNHWSLSRLDEPKEDDPKWIVPFRVQGPVNFTLIAVWACATKGRRGENYIGQIHLALTRRAEWFRRPPVVMAGDFNSNAIFDKKTPRDNHSSMVDALKNYGLESAYHSHYKKEHGIDEAPTFHMYRKAEKPFHLDYIFSPIGWHAGMSVKIGTHDEWATKSDHCPLTVEMTYGYSLGVI